MNFEYYLNRYELSTYNIFRWRYELSLVKKIALSLAFAGITGLFAQLKFYLPFTPVPVTGQVFAVLISGVFLGKYYGALSQLFYVTLGTFGLPWFAGFSGGLSIIFGITGGYLIGFVFASFLIGWFCERYISSRTILNQMVLMIFGIVIIYLFGAIQFSIVLNKNISDTIKLAILPFIPLDLLKAIFAAGLSTAILPKRAYNGEVDKEKYFLKKF